jgi:glycosyltransferase involved in cell wall biosynthesis
VLVQIDADLSHDPAALPTLLARLDEGADLVIGSRYVPGGSVPHWPLHRRALSRFGNRYTSFALHTGVNDATAGYRAYRADVLRRVRYDTTRAVGYGFQIELAYRVSRAGGKIVEVPITFTDRTRGQSKMSPKIAAEELLLVTWWGIRDRFGPGGEVPAPADRP